MQVSHAQVVQKTMTLPQTQFIDRAVNVPVVTQGQVPMLIEEVVPVVTQKQVLVTVETSQVHMQREVSAVEAVMQGQTSAGEKARSKIRGSWSKCGVVKKWPQETAGTEVERK